MGEYPFHICDRKLGWCATTEVDGVDRFPRQKVAPLAELIQQPFHIAGALPQRCGGEEAAVDAARLAERYVDVDASHVHDKGRE